MSETYEFGGYFPGAIGGIAVLHGQLYSETDNRRVDHALSVIAMVLRYPYVKERTPRRETKPPTRYAHAMSMRTPA